jgi:hypothetical protein
MAQFESFAGSMWYWSSVNGLPVVIAINAVVLVCALALAVHACRVSRELKKLGLARQRDATLIGKLMMEVDVCMSAIEARPVTPAIMDTWQEQKFDSSPMLGLREEIEMLHDEVTAPPSDSCCDLSLGDSTFPRLPEIDAFAQHARAEIECLRNELATEEEVVGNDGTSLAGLVSPA